MMVEAPRHSDATTLTCGTISSMVSESLFFIGTPKSEDDASPFATDEASDCDSEFSDFTGAFGAFFPEQMLCKRLEDAFSPDSAAQPDPNSPFVKALEPGNLDEFCPESVRDPVKLGTVVTCSAGHVAVGAYEKHAQLEARCVRDVPRWPAQVPLQPLTESVTQTRNSNVRRGTAGGDAVASAPKTSPAAKVLVERVTQTENRDEERDRTLCLNRLASVFKVIATERLKARRQKEVLWAKFQAHVTFSFAASQQRRLRQKRTWSALVALVLAGIVACLRCVSRREGGTLSGVRGMHGLGHVFLTFVQPLWRRAAYRGALLNQTTAFSNVFSNFA
uniref:Uncharacterized protein n=1 Tax=Noctiluca scintillans TaxID=2966 RepID=A0A7S1A0P5_NOCSC|eukprot:CAMPEP_0194515754 /NCGR_PEP_ID=MMETSP0253-20130528/48510_1 /TAXON_ID=2966 /ORGANISM="Noctiluca scintillans" /LENGTH=333 /DNA_ID=CAMNT_0039359533 /DNA_START=31 /DNA_END=1032 /DNA_ORIENTATION=-